MTVRLRPLIKPDGRISRIRLSESLRRRAFGGRLGPAAERALELPKRCGVVISCEPFPAPALLSGACEQAASLGRKSTRLNSSHHITTLAASCVKQTCATG